MARPRNHHRRGEDEADEPSVEEQLDDPAPEPLAAGPRPMGVGIMRVQKQRYRDWITAGGTPPIYT